ncbi:MAG TPA: prolyl oligopeptidase family serine peptidase [Gemmatimonadaceae bacterium]
MRTLLAAITLLAAAQPLHAQQPDGFDFSIRNIMRGPELVGRAPERIRWTPDGKWIYFYWNEPGADWREQLQPFRVRAEPGTKPERVTLAQMDSVGPLLEAARDTHRGRVRAVEYDGDLYVVDTKSWSVRRLTRTIDRETDPTLDITGRRVFFVRDDNVFSVDLDGGTVRQLTNIERGPAPKDSAAAKGQRGALEAQQKALFQVIRDEYRADSIKKAEKARHDSLFAQPLYLMKDEKVTQLAVSPDGKALLVVTRVAAEKPRETDVPRFVTKSGYVEEIQGREKVGDAQDGGRLAFVSLPSGAARWLHPIPDDTTTAPAVTQVLGWSDDGSRALVFTVRQNWKERLLETVSADSGAVRVVDALRDTAWVDGPCFGCGGWYDGGRRLWYVSEADGFAHLYTMAADGGDRRQLTSGKWEVLDVALSPDQRWFWMHTSEPSPFERQFYRMRVTGGARERITDRSGGHEVTPSPDGRMLADVYSFSNRPPELFVLPFRAGASMAQLTVSPTKAWLSFPWIAPDIVMIPASDGVEVPARIYRPEDMHAKPNGAAVIFVHGAGYLHNVHHWWSDYFREYMFNQFLASKGYVVLDEDYRGSAGYGRDWRTAIYRHMGGRDLQDEVDASRWLQRTMRISPDRIGIYGGSYGGFMTLMALFTAPKEFGAGAALRSVTDWAHYNHWYTSRILNLPDQDTVAYHRSSPIYFASGLEDPLLMAHGMVDTNVEYEDIVRLEQRLIELGKTDWWLASYPVENHGFVRPSSWADEYRRIFELFERVLRAPGTTPAATQGGH